MSDPITIAIVGGVAGGASAATRARRCNEHARIILFEKDSHVSFANCGLPYYIGGEIADRGKLLVATPKLFHERFNIEVHTRHEVTAIDRQRKLLTVLNRDTGLSAEHTYNKLILATGASPIVPPIDGVRSTNVFTLRNLEDADRMLAFIHEHQPHRAVVIGAGFIGLEMVEQLQRRGMKTALVELMEQVLPPLDREMAEMIEDELKRNGVDLHLGDGIKGLTTHGDRATGVVLNSGTQLDADLVVLGIGVRPSTQLAQLAKLDLGPMGGITVNEHLQTSDPDVYAVGDAVEYVHGVTGTTMRIPLAGPANRAGRLAGEHAATGRSDPMRPVLGTAIVRVFDLAAGITGLSEKLALRFEQKTRSVWIRANHHAGYFPGARGMTLKLIYEPDTGRILGAQGVGEAGVDKRIDVVATALAFGGNVRDLAGVDLAYAPPYGSAKDPIHMAAFTACNELDGLVHLASPGAERDGRQIVDVRTPAEVQRQPLAGAVNIPIDELRQRAGELDPARPTLTVCQSGLRSYVAARILDQHGFKDVVSLSGGMNMQR